VLAIISEGNLRVGITDAGYPIVYLDCIHVKVRDAGSVRAKAIYLAIGVNMEGHKEVMGCGLPRLRVPSSGSL
jgi:putative transposase